MSRRLKYSIRAAIVGIGIAFAGLPGCSRNNQADNSQNDSISKLCTQYAEVVQGFPDHPRSKEVLQLIVDQAKREALVSGEHPEDQLMYRFSDSNIGLYLLDAAYERLSASKPAEAFELCKQVQNQAPGTPIAVAALDKELGHLANSDSKAFLDRCSTFLAEDTHSPRERVALLRRAEFYRNSGRMKEASLDFLRFWAVYPDKVKAMDQADVIKATLRHAGFYLEAALLDTSTEPGSVARSLIADLGKISSNVLDSSGDRPLSVREQYIRFAPGTQEMQRTLESEPSIQAESKDSQGLQFARLAALHIQAHDVANAMRSCSRFLDILISSQQERESLQAPPFPLDLCRKWLTDSLLALNFPTTSDHEAPTGREKRSFVENRELFLALQDKGFQLDELFAKAAADDGPARLAKDLAVYADTAIRLNDKDRPLRAYRHFVELYPHASESPGVLLTMAEFYAKHLQSPNEASKTYLQVLERYPNSAQAEIAAPKRGVLLYGNGQYNEAYECLQQFIAEHPENSQIPLDLYVSALCEAALDSASTAEEHMRALTEKFPQHPVAANALLWLGSQHLARQQYGEARDIFTELIERFPNADAAKQAKEYADRLKTLGEKAPQ